MADIKISNLSGFDLFNDSESFMVELSDENEQIVGGKSIVDCLDATCADTHHHCRMFSLVDVVHAV
jgi:hypothetical protein